MSKDVQSDAGGAAVAGAADAELGHEEGASPLLKGSKLEPKVLFPAPTEDAGCAAEAVGAVLKGSEGAGATAAAAGAELKGAELPKGSNAAGAGMEVAAVLLAAGAAKGSNRLGAAAPSGALTGTGAGSDPKSSRETSGLDGGVVGAGGDVLLRPTQHVSVK